MQPLRIAIQLRSLRLPLRRAMETAARLGAAAVEIDARTELRPADLSETGRREFRKLLENLNLQVAAIGFRTRRGFNVADDLERRVAATKDAMRMANQLGCAVVVNQVGRVPDDAEASDWPTMLEALTDLGNFGNHIGATLTAETGSESGEDLARLIAALPDGAPRGHTEPRQFNRQRLFDRRRHRGRGAAHPLCACQGRCARPGAGPWRRGSAGARAGRLSRDSRCARGISPIAAFCASSARGPRTPCPKSARP